MSKLEGYKNHKNIVLAVYELLKRDYIITLTLVGLQNLTKKDPKLLKLIKNINECYPKSIIIKWLVISDVLFGVLTKYIIAPTPLKLEFN